MILLASSPASLPSWWSLLCFALSIKVVVAPAPCPSNAAVIGYTSIQEINNVMAKQLRDIQGGSAPQPPYIFSLCPNTTFVLTGEPLRILLNETFIICGANSALGDGCIIEGGAVQVSIADSTVPGYTLQDVKFQGITFRGATEASIDASAGSGTSATFIDCQWDGNSGNSTIQLIPKNTRLRAMSAVFKDCIVVNTTSTAIFANQNGTLQIFGLVINDSSGQAGIVTYSGGSTTIYNASVTSSNYPYLAQTGPGSILTVQEMQVSSLTGVTNLFVAQGNGSKMIVEDTSIHNIDSAAWTAISFTLGATGFVERTSIAQNTGLDFGIVASQGGSINVSDTTIANNLAPPGFVSSGVLALNFSSIYLSGSDFFNNTNFTSMAFVGFGSYGQINNNSFLGGVVTIVVFIDQDSTFAANNNTYDNITSSSCSPPNQRIFVENNGSHCFYRSIRNGPCTGKCGITTTLRPTTSPSQQISTPAPTWEHTVAPTISTTAPTHQTVIPTLKPIVSTLAPTQTTPPPSVARLSTSAPTALSASPFQPTTVTPFAPPSSVPVAPLSPTFSPSGVIYTSRAPSSRVKAPKAEKFKKRKVDTKGAGKLFKHPKSINGYGKQQQKAIPTVRGHKSEKNTIGGMPKQANGTFASESKATKYVYAKGTKATTKFKKGIAAIEKQETPSTTKKQTSKNKIGAKGLSKV